MLAVPLNSVPLIVLEFNNLSAYKANPDVEAATLYVPEGSESEYCKLPAWYELISQVLVTCINPYGSQADFVPCTHTEYVVPFPTQYIFLLFPPFQLA